MRRALLLAAGCLLTPRAASAAESQQPPTAFATEGGAALGLERGFGVFFSSTTRTLTSGAERSDQHIAFGFGSPRSPSPLSMPRVHIDVFVMDSWSVGFATGIGWVTGTRRVSVDGDEQSQDLPATTTLGFAPRIGVAPRLSESVWLWARAGVTYNAFLETITTPAGGQQQAGGSHLAGTIEALLVLSPVEPVAVTLGTVTDIPLIGVRDDADEKTLLIGVSVGALAWF